MTVSILTRGRVFDKISVSNTYPVTINGTTGFPPLFCFRKDAPIFVFTILDNDGTAFDLTDAGAVVRFSGKEAMSDTDANVIFSRDCLITNATGGICQVQLTPAETDFTGTSEKIVIVELEFTDDSSDTNTLGQTELTISPDVWRTT